MKTTITNLVTFLAIGYVTLAAANAFALGGGGGGNKGGFGIGFSRGGFSVGVGLGGGNNRKSNGYNNNNHKGNCQYDGGYNGQPYGAGQAYEPFHSYYFCQPGDSFYTVSLKEYGTSGVSKYIAQFNRLPLNAALVPGQRLLLPSVSANGRLTQSRAPAPFTDATPQGPFTTPTAKLTQPTTATTTNFASTVKPAETEPSLPKVTVGSTLLVDGQVFGEKKGVARLRISGLSLPVEVIEWNNDSAKITLPQLELTSPTKAEIEVLRADGSLVSKSGIELTPAETQLVLGN